MLLQAGNLVGFLNLLLHVLVRHWNAFVFHLQVEGFLSLVLGWLLLRTLKSVSLFVVLELHLSKRCGVYFAVDCHGLSWLFEALGRGHLYQVGTAGLFLNLIRSLGKLIRLKLFRSWKEIWRRHHVFVVQLSQVWNHSSLGRHLFLHKLVELVDTDVFELSVLTLSDEPVEDLFKGVLLPLLVC